LNFELFKSLLLFLAFALSSLLVFQCFWLSRNPIVLL
jgi:hypothetical protein